jgi:hypothetical protein
MKLDSRPRYGVSPYVVGGQTFFAYLHVNLFSYISMVGLASDA